MLVAVIGAGGYTGRACVEQALLQGHHVRAVVRDPERCRATYASQPTLTTGSHGLRDLPTPVGERLQIVAGDVTDPASLRAALQGCDGVVYAATSSGWAQLSAFWRTMRTTRPQAVDHQGVRNAAEAALEAGRATGRAPPRFVLVSAITATPKNRRTAAGWVINRLLRWGLMDAKWQGEQALRRSGLQYTIIRPDYITAPTPHPTWLEAQQGDPPPREFRLTSVADLAAVAVAALSDPAAARVTLELFSSKAPPGSLAGAATAAAPPGSSGNGGGTRGGGQPAGPPPRQEQVAGLFKRLLPDEALAAEE